MFWINVWMLVTLWESFKCNWVDLGKFKWISITIWHSVAYTPCTLLESNLPLFHLWSFVCTRYRVGWRTSHNDSMLFNTCSLFTNIYSLYWNRRAHGEYARIIFYAHRTLFKCFNHHCHVILSVCVNSSILCCCTSKYIMHLHVVKTLFSSACSTTALDVCIHQPALA